MADETGWGEEMAALREILRGCPLEQGVKWGQTCYTSGDKNIVLIHAFRDYCALLFFKGALMKDPQKLLIRQSENVQAGRQMRFVSLKAVKAARAAIKSYVEEAIAIEQAGLKVAKKTTAEFPRPEEFEQKLAATPALRAAFAALTPGRQRAYLLHFAGAKQSATRRARIDKCAEAILAGKGLDD